MATRSEGLPHDRLTQMGDAALTFIREAPDYQNERVIVMLNTDERGGIAIGGYEDDADALVDMFMHLKAIMEANGKSLSFLSMDEDGVG